jgi:hypothetical protein
MIKPKRTKDVRSIYDHIISIYKKGGNINDAEEYLKSLGRHKSIRSDIWQVNNIIKRNSIEERETLINTHVKRYEKMFDEHFSKTENDFAHLPPKYRKFMLIDSLIIAMDALIAKEKVLGLHSRQFRVQLNNFFKKKIVAQYNFNNQDINDLIRLKQLLAKMKETDQAVVQNDDLENETKSATIDIDHIEVNTEVSNKIKETVTVNKNGNFTPKQIVQDITDKIVKEDLKKHDPHRQLFLEKLKGLNTNGKNGK